MASRKTFIHKVRAVRGFSLIEIIVVMSLFIAVAGIGLFVSMDSYRGFMFRSERDTIVSLLNKARSQALNNMCFGATCSGGKAHGVHFAAGQYTLFQGSTYAGRDTGADEVITAQDLTASVTPLSDVVFSPLAATTSFATFTITQDSHSSVITVGSEGQIQWTN